MKKLVVSDFNKIKKLQATAKELVEEKNVSVITHSLTHSLIHSLTHHSFTHSLTHSLITPPLPLSC